MPLQTVPGRLARLELSLDGEDWATFGGAIDIAMSISIGELQATTHDDNGRRVWIPGHTDYSMRVDARYIDEDPGQCIAHDTVDTLTKVHFRYSLTGWPGRPCWRGLCFLRTGKLKGPLEGTGGFDVTFRCTAVWRDANPLPLPDVPSREVFRIPPTYASLDASGLFEDIVQEWWDFYAYGYDAILETNVAKIAIAPFTVAAAPYTVCMRVSVPSIESFIQLPKDVPRQTQIDLFQATPGGFNSMNATVQRVGSTAWLLNGPGAGQTYAFGDEAYVIYSISGSTSRCRLLNGSVVTEGDATYTEAKACFDGYSGIPPASHGAFPNLLHTHIRSGAAAITNAWHYWDQALDSAEIDELADWIDAGKDVV